MTDQKQFSLPRHKLFKLTATSSPLMLMPVMIRTVCLIVMVVLGSGPTAAQSNVGTLKVAYSEAKGIGPQKGVMRRDPSDIIKVDDLYYLWYSKGKIGPGYDATVWYATSPDGRNWTEKGMALAKGQPGSWEGESVFTPNILVAEGRYWLFYTGVSKKFGKKYNPDSKIGIAVSDSPNGPWERLATNPALKNSDQPEFLPTRQGFDEYFGIPYSHDIHPFHGQQKKYNFPSLPLLEGETVVEMDPDADYLTKRITERAVRFIKENKDAPFFLYVPHPIPHRPLSMSPPFMKDVPKPLKAKLALEKQNNTIDYKTRDKLLRQAIAEIDWSVGQILDTLKAQGIDENTFVIFTSDNGPSLPGKATPLSGKKGSTLEGGMREPTVIRWPGKIPEGVVNDELVTAMDLLPTFARLAGAELPADRVIDGKDIWPVLTGNGESPHEAFFYHKGNKLEAVRSGKWKLHLALSQGGRKGKARGKAKGAPAPALYDLEADIGEKTNVLAYHPDVAKHLRSYVKAFEEELAQNSRPAAFVDNPKPLSMGAK